MIKLGIATTGLSAIQKATLVTVAVKATMGYMQGTTHYYILGREAADEARTILLAAGITPDVSAATQNDTRRAMLQILNG